MAREGEQHEGGDDDGSAAYWRTQEGGESWLIFGGKRFEDKRFVWKRRRDPRSGRSFFVNAAVPAVKAWKLPPLGEPSESAERRAKRRAEKDGDRKDSRYSRVTDPDDLLDYVGGKPRKPLEVLPRQEVIRPSFSANIECLRVRKDVDSPKAQANPLRPSKPVPPKEPPPVGLFDATALKVALKTQKKKGKEVAADMEVEAILEGMGFKKAQKKERRGKEKKRAKEGVKKAVVSPSHRDASPGADEEERFLAELSQSPRPETDLAEEEAFLAVLSSAGASPPADPPPPSDEEDEDEEEKAFLGALEEGAEEEEDEEPGVRAGVLLTLASIPACIVAQQLADSPRSRVIREPLRGVREARQMFDSPG
eukprot:Hpha_TRINITY_DN12184_c0_g1::TRINITY_DN12184_c0_g1_i1::g.82125::m.82125